MKLTVYKGFNTDFLSSVSDEPLLRSSIIDKKNVLNYDRRFRKKLDIALLSLDDDDEVWITYEEYSLIKNRIDDAIDDDGLELTILKNNIYPDYYPIEFDMDSETVREIIDTLNGEKQTEKSDVCQNYLAIYNSLVDADGVLYGSFYNYEYGSEDKIEIRDYYPQNIVVEDAMDSGEYDVFLNEDIDTYLRDLTRIIKLKPSIISLDSTNGNLSQKKRVHLFPLFLNILFFLFQLNLFVYIYLYS